jgi:hypothetical protein
MVALMMTNSPLLSLPLTVEELGRDGDLVDIMRDHNQTGELSQFPLILQFVTQLDTT